MLENLSKRVGRCADQKNISFNINLIGSLLSGVEWRQILNGAPRWAATGEAIILFGRRWHEALASISTVHALTSNRDLLPRRIHWHETSATLRAASATSGGCVKVVAPRRLIENTQDIARSTRAEVILIFNVREAIQVGDYV